MKKLYDKHCQKVERTTKPLVPKRIETLHNQLTKAWDVIGFSTLRREFVFDDFIDAMVFVNDVAAIVDEEQHYPDIVISENKVTIELTTAVIDGLTENDFIIARKIELLA